MYDGIASRAPRLTTTVIKVAEAYRPSTWKEKGLWWTAGLFLVTYLGIVVVLGMIWSTSPGPFDVKEKALALVNNDPAKLVPGTFTVATAIGIAEDPRPNVPEGTAARSRRCCRQSRRRGALSMTSTTDQPPKPVLTPRHTLR
jgi:hypothetical protein